MIFLMKLFNWVIFPSMQKSFFFSKEENQPIFVTRLIKTQIISYLFIFGWPLRRFSALLHLTGRLVLTPLGLFASRFVRVGPNWSLFFFLCMGLLASGHFLASVWDIGSSLFYLFIYFFGVGSRITVSWLFWSLFWVQLHWYLFWVLCGV